MIFDRPDAVANEIQRFVTGAAPPVETDRVLAGVLFTDIVGSTEVAAERGDASWRGLLDDLDSLVVTETQRLGGQVIKSTGDGHLLTFGGPSRAIQCGQAIRSAAALGLGLSLRAGVHVGEIELRGKDVAGIGVVIARRVCDLAEPGQILVSHSVPPLVAGADFSFASRGARQLKGVPGEWTLHEVL
jgi:class 3 adenylate cyclase